MTSLVFLDEFGPIASNFKPWSNSFVLKDCNAFEFYSGCWPNKRNCLLIAIDGFF